MCVTATAKRRRKQAKLEKRAIKFRLRAKEAIIKAGKVKRK